MFQKEQLLSYHASQQGNPNKFPSMQGQKAKNPAQKVIGRE
jgi:hypothetical protein